MARTKEKPVVNNKEGFFIARVRGNIGYTKLQRVITVPKDFEAEIGTYLICKVVKKNE